jgi:Tfp pilus assembly protein PilF
MLDALRHHKASPPDREGTPKRGTAGSGVPAPLAQAFGQEPTDERTAAEKRLGLALLLVAVTALLVWQVAAMNGLLPAGPLSWLLKPAGTDAGLSLSSPTPPSQTALPRGHNPAPAPETAPTGPAARPPAAAVSEGAETRDIDKAPTRTAAADPVRPATRPQIESLAATPAHPRPQRPQPAGPPPAGVNASATVGVRAPIPPAKAAGETDHFKLALYYQRVGDFENALIHYRTVIAADELNAEAHNNLGVLYQGKGLYDEAIKEFQRATFIDPRYDKAHNNLGVALLRSGKTDAAIVEFRGIVSRDPRHVDALSNLALALKAAGRAEEARETLQRVLTINGRHAQAHYNLALIYEERAEWQRAIEHFEQFLANTGSESAALSADVRARVQALRARLQ